VASVGESLNFLGLLISCLWRVTVFWSLLVSDEGWVLYAMIFFKRIDTANFLYLHVIQSRFVRILFLWAAVFDCNSAHCGSNRFCFGDFEFDFMKNSKNLFKKWNSGLGVGEHLQRPRIFCIISGIPEMMLSDGTSDVRLTFA
jgi:hypothetical protein